jgi:hypothetical protein
MKKKTITLLSVAILLIVLLSQITFFVIQPIGAVPDGRTLIILRMNKTKLFDSADAMCEREMGSVSLLCRGMMMGPIGEKGTILARLPYSEFLYNISTDGKTYER